jgi:hypothetical protein
MHRRHHDHHPIQVHTRASDPGMRIGDAERGRVVDQLADHHAAGRLTLEEFQDILVRDLPTQPRPSRPPVAATRLRLDPHARTYLAVIALLWLIWLVTGAGYPWPIWPMLGWGIGVFGHHRGHARSAQDRPRGDGGPLGLRGGQSA